jgi:chromosomal replication initiation ATPase DnaA
MKPTVTQIINAVLDVYGLNASALLGSSRTALLSDARMTATGLLHEELGLKATAIARIFNRSRPTVLYYLKVYRWRDLPLEDCRKLLGNDEAR